MSLRLAGYEFDDVTGDTLIAIGVIALSERPQGACPGLRSKAWSLSRKAERRCWSISIARDKETLFMDAIAG